MSEDRRMEAGQRYISGGETLQEIAAALGIPLSSLKRWCKADKWVDKRRNVKRRAANRAATAAVRKKAKALARLIEGSEEMEKALLIVARSIAEKAESGNVGIKESRHIYDLAASFEKMASVRQMTGDTMTAADAEKIAILQKKQAMDEKKAALEEKKDAGDAVIRIEGEGEALSE